MSSTSKLIAGTAALAVVAAGGAAFAAVKLSESTGSSAGPAVSAPFGRGLAGSGLSGRLGGRGFGGGLGQGPRSGFRGGFGFGSPRFFGGVSTAVSAYLGLSAAAVQSDLQKGRTLAQIAKAQGKSVDGLVTAMLNDQKKRLDAAVTRGLMTQAEAAQLEANLKQNISDMVNGVHPTPPVPVHPTA